MWVAGIYLTWGSFLAMAITTVVVVFGAAGWWLFLTAGDEKDKRR